MPPGRPLSSQKAFEFNKKRVFPGVEKYDYQANSYRSHGKPTDDSPSALYMIIYLENHRTSKYEKQNEKTCKILPDRQ